MRGLVCAKRPSTWNETIDRHSFTPGILIRCKLSLSSAEQKACAIEGSCEGLRQRYIRPEISPAECLGPALGFHPAYQGCSV